MEERPDWTEARLNLAMVLEANRQPQAAFAIYRDLLARQPPTVPFLMLAGNAALAADPARLAVDRRAPRPLLQASRLGDAASFARAFEDQRFALAASAML